LTIEVNVPGAGTRLIDLSACIQPDHPITASFEVVPASQLRTDRAAKAEDLEAFLNDPAADWFPYSAGIPYPRYNLYEQLLKKMLKRVSRGDAALRATAWIDAEDGSGATTLLRHICFALAWDGHPVLLARPDADGFDFRQVEAFLRSALERMTADGIAAAALPWVIAFDVEHTERHRGFIGGLANGLGKLERAAVVLGVGRAEQSTRLERHNVSGGSAVIGEPLSSYLSLENVEALGRHLGRFLPPGMVRNPSEWKEFVDNTVRTTIEGRRSLFWVALRFWLFRLPGAERPVRQWLAEKFEALAADNPATYSGLLETAVLAKYRLATPMLLLPPHSSKALWAIADAPANPLGLRLVGRSMTFTHPLIAEELLRIALGIPAALAAVEKYTCMNLLDLELHLLGRIIARPEAGDPEAVPLIEELVVTGLRVDPQEAPRNYAAREQIVSLLEKAPTSLWDCSQVFNHHVAKARRHLAKDPPHRDWTISARREQLELAEQHLADALHNIKPPVIERCEHPLNLWVSLSLTYDARAQLEQEAGDNSQAADYDRKAAEAFATALRIDPDNTYVLENHARFKLRQAAALPMGDEKVRLLIEAIGFLEHDLEVDSSGARGVPILEALGRAYKMLGERYDGPGLEALAPGLPRCHCSR
jgi:tetratricopeptide (TPR) repeat protein